MRSLRSSSTALTLALATAVSPACRERDESFTRPIELTNPVVLGTGVLWIDRPSGTAFHLDVAPEREGTVRSAHLGRTPVFAEPRNTTTEALVLTQGSRGDRNVEPEPARLFVLPAGATEPARTYEVGSPFNAVSQTADGRYAFVYFRPDSTTGRLLFNPNEVAMIDLAADPSPTNPALRTVRSFGGVPNTVLFSPPMMVGGTRRTLAVVLSSAYVTLLDLEHPEQAEVTVRLTLPEDTRTINPVQVLFDTEDPTLYVRGDDSNDVYVLRLGTVPPPAPGASDLRPTINQLAAGRNPSDMLLIGTGTDRRLLVVSPGSSEARVIDARSNASTVITLDAPADRIYPFTGAAPDDPMTTPRALLYSLRGFVQTVTFLDLTNVEARGRQNAETVRLSAGANAVLPLPDRGAVMFSHTSGSSGLSLLDLQRRTTAPIVSEVTLNGARFDANQQTLWVAPYGNERVAWVDLRTFHPAELRLDAGAVNILPVPDAGTGRIVVVHGGQSGHVTLLDARDPRRESAVTLHGILLEALFDRGSL